MSPERTSQRIHRRRSPLVIGAVAAFIVACVVAVLVITKPNGLPRSTIRSVEIAEPENVPAVGAANAGQTIVDVSRTTRDARDAGASAVEVPVWARSPGIWTTPYPEGGRYNPPLPAVKLPPEMLGSASPDAGASADGKQLDVEDDRALR